MESVVSTIRHQISENHATDLSKVVYVIWEWQQKGNPAGKYWSPGRPPPTSPGRPLKILFDRPGDVPIWRPGDVLKWRPGDVLIWRSRDVPGRLIRDVPRTFSGRPLEDLESTQTWMSNFFLTFLSELIRLTKSKSISTLKEYWESSKTSKMEHFLQN